MNLHSYYYSLTTDAREAFAAAAGTKPSYIVILANGHQEPSAELAKRLHLASGGQIPLSTLRPDLWSEAAA